MKPAGAIFFGLSLVFASPGALAEPVESPAHAQYARAQEALKQQDWEEARRLLLELWSKVQTYDVAASLGQAEFHLKDYASAAQHMAFAVANAPPMEHPDVLEKFRVGLEQLKKRVATVSVTVNVAEHPLSLGVDGAPREVRSFPAEIFLEPGSHVIEVANDRGALAKRLDVAAGQAYQVEFNLTPKKPLASSQATVDRAGPIAPRPQADGAERAPSMVPVIVGGAITLVGVGVGTGFALAASSNASDADALRSRIGSGVCGETAAAADCSALKAAADNRQRNQNTAVAGFAIGATALIATGAYWLLSTLHNGETSPTQETGQLRMSVSGGDHAGVVWLSGEF
jgi:hypothetical protein